MKKTLFTLLTLTFCCALVIAEEEFKYDNMYYVCTSDSTVKLSRGYLIGDIVIPDTVQKDGNKYAVTEIGNAAFNVYYNPQITSVVIPETVEMIRAWAFSGQTELYDIYFLGCQHITFESNIFSEYRLEYQPRRVHIKNFESWCNNTYPRSSELGVMWANPFYKAYMYMNGEKVKDLKLSKNVTTISASAFEGLLNSINLTCDTGLISIGDFAFTGAKVQNVELPPSLKKIGRGAFKRCPIQNLTIPENVTSIGVEAFDYNYPFHKIIWKAKSLHCQNNVPGYATFLITSGQLDTLVIDTGVVSLPEYMFYSTLYAVKPIIISYSKTVPYVYQNTFYAVNKKSPLYVPKGKKNDYISSWKFTNVYEMVDDTEINEILETGNTMHTKTIMRNGQIFILRGGKVYTLQGQKIK